jgi:hypothetical protein
LISNLLRPMSYLSISHQMKWKVDWLYPLVAAFMSTAVLLIARRYGPVPVFGDSGIYGKILSFTQNLPGFYIAALAAIATFNRSDIDKIMPEPAPSIDITRLGKSENIKLTRRRFLSSMFAFLTAESILIVVLCMAAQELAPTLKSVISLRAQEYATSVALLVLLTLFWQMLITSFWGLFYLGDKLHQPDAT